MRLAGGQAGLLERSLLEATPLKPGEKIAATVLQIGAEWLFMKTGLGTTNHFES